MEYITDVLSQVFVDGGGLVLALSTGLAALLVFFVKALFALAAYFAAKTKTTVDDDIVRRAKESFKEKTKDI